MSKNYKIWQFILQTSAASKKNDLEGRGTRLLKAVKRGLPPGQSCYVFMTSPHKNTLLQ